MANENRINKFVDKLNLNISQGGLTPSDAYQDLLDDLEDFGANNDAKDALKIAYHKVQKEIQNVEFLTQVHSLRIKREPWYSGPQDNSPSWNAYKQHLLNKGWATSINSIDESSTGVVSLLNRPGLSQFNGRGLVLGYVQSGKTANMAGVIAKATDAGYRLVIILTGMIEKLRKQTQLRFQEDLLDHETTVSWHPWTTGDDDFTHPTQPGFQFSRGARNVMVIKKNDKVLDRILAKLKNTATSELAQCPVLIIDDECDQASVNSPTGKNLWKTINRQIRQITDYFPRVSYVGYTATPFANVLIDPAIDPKKPDDLYPRDFLYSIPKPDGYFGAEELFGRTPLDADEEPAYNEELDILREVPEGELDKLRPAGRKHNFKFAVTKTLKDAINYYIIATSIRNLRGDRDKHSTMLIHTSQKVDVHSEIFTGVGKVITDIKAHLMGDSSLYEQELKDLWKNEKVKVPPTIFGYEDVSFKQLIAQIKETTASIALVVENSANTTERIDYDAAPEDKGRRYICIGGNVLARGLTLEGLVSSFFLRTSSQYDTLMQMGRWFGFRRGYEDLPRVWMTNDMRANFNNLATVEADIRYQIEVYYERKYMTPSDLAVKIRKIPGLAITAKNKMLAAENCSLSFSGQHKQTLRFYHKNTEKLASNWQAGANLIDQASRISASEKREQGHLLRHVDRTLIEEVLDQYCIHDSQADLIDNGSNHLLDYISRAKEKDGDYLKNWNVGIVQPKTKRGKNRTEVTLGSIDKLKTINRAKLNTSMSNGDADIKALMSADDLRMDLDPAITTKRDWGKIKDERTKHEASKCPMLLLYLIDKDSEPANKSGMRNGIPVKNPRGPLEAAGHILGFGIVFPPLADDNDPTYYVSVKLPDPEDAEDGILEEEEAES